MLRWARIPTIRWIMKPKRIFTALLSNFTKNAASPKLLVSLISLAVLALPTLLMAHAGDLDPTFGTGGIVTTANTGADAAALQSDGKIVVAGSIANNQNFQQPGLLRYNTNGMLDSSFGTGGEVMIGGTNAGPAFAVAVQTDGKILVAAPSNLRLTVFRFNTNGSPDNTFGSNGAVAIQAAGDFLAPASGGMAVQSDGKILVVSASSALGSEHIVARLLANGQLDSTFGSNGTAPTVGGDSVALLPNSALATGEILISDGSTTSLYKANGSLESKFGINGQAAGFVSNGAGGFVAFNDPLTSATKIIIVGSLTTSPSLTFGQSVLGFLLVRYNSDGTVDNSFGSHGGVATPFPGNIFAQAFSVARQTNGDLVVAGQTHGASGPSSFGLVRYNPNGTIDTTFGNAGFVSTPFGSSVAFANAVLIQIDGKIVAAGNSNSGTTLTRYLGN